MKNLSNPILREQLEHCNTIRYNPSKHVKFLDLKYNSIYKLDKLSRKKWLEYFKTSGVYLNKDVKSSRISQRILFDNSLLSVFDLKQIKTREFRFREIEEKQFYEEKTGTV